MKKEDLRIGNIVLTYRKECKITASDFAVFELYESRKEEPPYNPIPLTEEWLRKLHSENEIEKNGRFPNEITIYDRFLFIWKESYKYWYVVTAYHKEYLTKIEFVHEYQNFIYSCNGTELTIK